MNSRFDNPWRDTFDDMPDWHDVGRRIELRRGQERLVGELTAEDYDDTPVCYVDGQFIMDWDQWRFARSRFPAQVWGQGPGPVAIAITLSKQSSNRYQRLRERARYVKPRAAVGGFPYPARTQRQVRLHEQGFDW